MWDQSYKLIPIWQGLYLLTSSVYFHIVPFPFALFPPLATVPNEVVVGCYGSNRTSLCCPQASSPHSRRARAKLPCQRLSHDHSFSADPWWGRNASFLLSFARQNLRHWKSVSAVQPCQHTRDCRSRFPRLLGKSPSQLQLPGQRVVSRVQCSQPWRCFFSSPSTRLSQDSLLPGLGARVNGHFESAGWPVKKRTGLALGKSMPRSPTAIDTVSRARFCASLSPQTCRQTVINRSPMSVPRFQ